MSKDKRVYILLAEGFETIEALATVDVLERAGFEVTKVAVDDECTVYSSQNVGVLVDTTLAKTDCADADLIILPGGNPGFENLCASERVGQVLKAHYDRGGLLGAICGAPTVLLTYDIAKGRRLTCHSSVREQMANGGYNVSADRVVVDGNLVTAPGAGRSIDFAMTLAAILAEDRGAVAGIIDGFELARTDVYMP